MVQLTKKIAELWRSNQVVRYAICGGGNMVFDWVLYFLLYNFVVGHEIVKLSIINYQLSITPHIATLCIVFPITLLSGFALQKYITFTDRGRTKEEGVR